MLNSIKDNIKRLLVSKQELDDIVKESCSQSGEDVIVDFIFKHILNQPQFNYFDVGAHHPTWLSNTALFYKKGMRGVCIEPDPLLYKDFAKARPDDVCLNAGIGFNKDDSVVEEMDFYVMSVRALNTFSKKEAEKLNVEGKYTIKDIKKISVLHLHKLFKKHFVPDFLSLDVEGIDFEILQSIDFLKYRPKVICIETAEFSPIPPGKKVYEAIYFLEQRDYLNYADTFNNTIFIDKNQLHK